MIDTPRLKDRSSKLDWANLVFVAEAERERFDEVTVTTLKAEFEDQVYDLAWIRVSDPSMVYGQAINIIESGDIKVSPYIKVTNDSIKICLDRDKVTDEVIEEALDMLLEVDLGPDSFTTLGDRRSFTVEEMNLKEVVDFK